MEACSLLGAEFDTLTPALRRRAVQTCERLVFVPVCR